MGVESYPEWTSTNHTASFPRLRCRNGSWRLPGRIPADFHDYIRHLLGQSFRQQVLALRKGQGKQSEAGRTLIRTRSLGRESRQERNTQAEEFCPHYYDCC